MTLTLFLDCVKERRRVVVEGWCGGKGSFGAGVTGRGRSCTRRGGVESVCRPRVHSGNTSTEGDGSYAKESGTRTD